jgi:7-carboxy-7-deazaguanine synthase
MLFADVVPLTAELSRLGMHITIETAATVDRPVSCDLMSISPKLANSSPSLTNASTDPPTDPVSPKINRRHEQARHAPQVVRRLIRDYPYQMKFVVDNLDDCQEVQVYLQ